MLFFQQNLSLNPKSRSRNNLQWNLHIICRHKIENNTNITQPIGKSQGDLPKKLPKNRSGTKIIHLNPIENECLSYKPNKSRNFYAIVMKIGTQVTN